jgi:hypothetical protein
LNSSAIVALNGRVVYEVHKLYGTDEFQGYAADPAAVDALRMRFRAGNAGRENSEGAPDSTTFAVGRSLFTLEISRDHEQGRAAADLDALRVPKIDGARRGVADVRIVLSRDGGVPLPSLPGVTVVNDGALEAPRPGVPGDRRRGARRAVYWVTDETLVHESRHVDEFQIRFPDSFPLTGPPPSVSPVPEAAAGRVPTGPRLPATARGLVPGSRRPADPAWHPASNPRDRAEHKREFG